MAKALDVLCIGLMVMDIVAYPVPEDLFRRDTGILERLELIPGGDAVNQAAVCAWLGCKTAIAGKVGADSFGRQLLDGLARQGVDVSGVAVDPAVATNVSLALVKQDGARSFLCRDGQNNKCLSLADIDKRMVESARAVSYAGMYFLRDLDGSMGEVFANARRAGAITVADCSFDAFSAGIALAESVLPHTDYFIPSYEEASHIAGETDTGRIARRLRELGARNVVIKLGDRGAYVLPEGGDGVLVPAFTGLDVVDTTGAGDHFAAGLIAALLDGLALRDAVVYACAAGALAVQALGATGAAVSRAKVAEMIRSHSRY